MGNLSAHGLEDTFPGLYELLPEAEETYLLFFALDHLETRDHEAVHVLLGDDVEGENARETLAALDLEVEVPVSQRILRALICVATRIMGNKSSLAPFSPM